ncbi:MAG: sulfur oxidation c-type cytochrome SoxX [Steroidobacteraceae bacterium]
MNKIDLSQCLALMVLAACAVPALAEAPTTALPAAALESFRPQDPAWAARLVPDDTQATCIRSRNLPEGEEAAALLKRETDSVRFPADGKLLGDWRRGEAIAQNGRGLQHSDGPDTVVGGNCYACHQIAPDEIGYGTLGPSLLGYGRLRGQGEFIQRYTWTKIYNAQAYVPCSIMPRFGTQGILTEQDIKDLMALLLDPDSPVNAEPVAETSNDSADR